MLDSFLINWWLKLKKIKKDVTDSITKFFMHNCKCLKSENGYYQWKCVAGKCSECKLIQPRPFECASSEQKIKISQFEVTETPYKKTVDGKEVDKISKKNKKNKNKNRESIP